MPPNISIAEKLWKDFSHSYGMKLQMDEQPLLSNKVYIYQALEKQKELLMFYRYKFFSLDPDGYGDDFRLITPCTEDLHISKLPFFKRIFQKEKIKVQTELSGNFDQELKDLLHYFFRTHSKLTIKSGEPEIYLPWDHQQQLLEIRTRRLPERIEELEQFRNLAIKLRQQLSAT